MCFIWFAHCSQIVLEEKHLTILPIRQYSKSSKGEGEYNILNCISNRESLSQISIWHSIIQNLTLKVNWKQTESQHPCWSALGYCSEARITWTYMFFCNSAYIYTVFRPEIWRPEFHPTTDWQNAVISGKLLYFHCLSWPFFWCLILTF